MTHNNSLAKSIIYRYISDHCLNEGEQLPDPKYLAALYGHKVTAVESALEVACQAGILVRSPVGGFVVRSIPKEQAWLSFSHSAALHGKRIDKTTVREAKLRLPLLDPDDPITTGFEKEAHRTLGLEEGEPFIVISRIRLLGGSDSDAPRVIHRVYLDPKRFPISFLSDHDFALESIVRIYNHHGYVIRRRMDRARARLACPSERIDLEINLSDPVLDVAQHTVATAQDDQTPFVLEYLRATYWNLTFEFER